MDWCLIRRCVRRWLGLSRIVAVRPAPPRDRTPHRPPVAAAEQEFAVRPARGRVLVYRVPPPPEDRYQADYILPDRRAADEVIADHRAAAAAGLPPPSGFDIKYWRRANAW